jgi:hypothetical protein
MSGMHIGWIRVGGDDIQDLSVEVNFPPSDWGAAQIAIGRYGEGSDQAGASAEITQYRYRQPDGSDAVVNLSSPTPPSAWSNNLTSVTFDVSTFSAFTAASYVIYHWSNS